MIHQCIPQILDRSNFKYFSFNNSCSFELTSAMMTQRKCGKFEAEENDYDVVPDYIEREKFYTDG